MAVAIIMPKFEMTQEVARVMTWLIAEGDVVEKGDPLMEVETDKVTMEVEAPESGILRGLAVKEGDVVPVTEVIGYIVPEGEAWSPDQLRDLKDVEAAAPPSSPPKVTPIAQRIAAAAAINLSDVPTPPGDGKIRRQHVEQYLQQRPVTVPVNGGKPSSSPGKVRATPAARRLAREYDLPLNQISGSGPRGRVQAGDVRADHQQTVAVTSQQLAQFSGDDLLPLSQMRRTIAARMTQSYQSVPHTTFTVTADMTAALDLRRRLNVRAEKEGATPVSVTAVLVKVCAWALGRRPLVNASWSEEGIRLHRQANIGVAVALDEGLIVPVIRNAAALGLAEISSQLGELTERARSGRLQPQDVQGGTFTISNLGMLGIDQFTAIINPPQSAILAVGRTNKVPVVMEKAEGDELAIRPMMKMTLSVDHRSVDGAVAARFLQDVVAGLIQPDELLW